MNKIFEHGLFGLASKLLGKEKSKDSNATSAISPAAVNAVEDGTTTPASPQMMKKGGKVSSASSRADGCATKGKTKGRFV